MQLELYVVELTVAFFHGIVKIHANEWHIWTFILNMTYCIIYNNKHFAIFILRDIKCVVNAVVNVLTIKSKEWLV